MGFNLDTQATRSTLMSVDSTLSEAITASQDYIPIASTTNFSTSVVAEIETTNEVVSFTDISSNIGLYSQVIGTTASTAWASTRLDLTQDALVAPDGTTTATKAAQQSGQTSSGTCYRPNSVSSTSGLTYTLSVFAKVGTNRDYFNFNEQLKDGSYNETWFNISSGTVGTTNADHTAVISDVGDGWYRCSITFTCSSSQTDSRYSIYVDEADNSRTVTDDQGFLYLWGNQFEIAASATTYLPTTTTAPLYGLTDVTRGANGTTAQSASASDSIQQLPYALSEVNMPTRLKGLSVTSDGTGVGRLTLCDKVGTTLCDVDLPDNRLYELSWDGGIIFPNGIYVANSDNITAYTLFTDKHSGPNLGG
jgi:hypothetical protein